MADTPEIENLAAVRAAFEAIPGIVEKKASDEIDDWVAEEQSRITAAANKASKLARLVAHGIKAGNGQIKAGGSGKPAPGTGTYGDLFFGAEFGGGSRPETRQFVPYKPSGHWFFPTIEGDQDDLDKAAEKALDAAATRWAD